MLQAGPFEVHSVQTGTFRLDGGAMFGVVPKTMWGGSTDVDDQNRIALATRSLLALDRASGRVVIVDTGCGSKWLPEAAERFAINHDAGALNRALATLGLSAADVTDVIVTHLHFDHNGGLTEWVDRPGGATRLCFPRARHWIHRAQWAHAHNPTPKDRASYLSEDWAGLEDSGMLRFVEGDAPAPPLDGITWFISHGHSPYQLHPIIGGDDRRVLWTGDIIPTVAHLRTPWVMAYDLHPLTTIAEKSEFARRGIVDGVILALPHDPKVGGVLIDGRVERPIVSRAVL